MKKIKTILTDGLEPFFVGKQNYEKNIKEVEDLAKQRAEICVKCPFFKDEPIDIFKIKDDRINELSGKMCNDCGCELPYKLRQSIKTCKYWENLL